MKRNVGKRDKMVRVIIALVLAALVITEVVTGVVATLFIIGAGIALFSTLISFCGLYTIFGINTCRVTSDKS